MLLEVSEAYPRNYLFRFELAQMYAAIGERSKALAILDDIRSRKDHNLLGYARIPSEKIYYETGNLMFWFNDLDRSLQNLRKVTGSREQLKELDLNTGALAFMRQGQIHDLQNRHDLAAAAYQQAIQFAPDAEAAKESQKYIDNPYKRPQRN
jgi:tetratricopeptide (TPR) repeat protein